ncbi:MAG: hypothetical protein WBP44_16825 [Gammaproteobacteria bacterium]
MTMTRRLRTLLLLFITLALAFAPLRGALALPATASTDTDSHCAGMMHGMPAADGSTQQQAATPESQTEDCCHQCDGSCADGNCSDCVHSTIGIANSSVIHPEAHNTAPTPSLLVSFPPGNFSPPYRPPVSI